MLLQAETNRSHLVVTSSNHPLFASPISKFPPEVYRIWTCSALVPYFHHSGPPNLDFSEKDWTRIRPCMSLCQSVEQRCPYMLPGDRAPAYPTQYAGEPTFLCRDPNIPETGEQALRALHSSDERECCYHVCSKDEVGLGICANCTGRELRKIGREHDPPTAPHCDITPIQSDSAGEEKAAEWPVSTDGQDIESDSTSTISPMVGLDQQQQQQQHQSTSLCGSGGVGSMTSSSSNRVTASNVLPYLSLSSIIIQIFWWSCLLLRSFSRTMVVLIRSVLYTGRGFASFVVVVVVVVVVGSGGSEEDEGGGGGGRGGGVEGEGREREGRGGKMRSIEEIRPRSRSGSSCFRWWCSSLSSRNSKLTISLDKKDKRNKKKKEDDNNNNNNNINNNNINNNNNNNNNKNNNNNFAKEGKKKKKKKEEKEEDEDEEEEEEEEEREMENKNRKKKKREWYKVWLKRWCCWWSSWRKRRKKKSSLEYGGRKSIVLLPIVVNVVVVHVVVVHVVLEIIRSNKMTTKEQESRRRPRHRRRRYKLEPRRGRCRWRWKEDNSYLSLDEDDDDDDDYDYDDDNNDDDNDDDD
ncbi:hypothetical protein M0802_013847 [Mischocyttarus mexicanus]|nr:hypothetical protein M0802_013848 [Mischocyttarus mexicanus]KAI4481913.1 hypothetical protein M0802_013847 [Mischocyttarus mexicanus]